VPFLITPTYCLPYLLSIPFYLKTFGESMEAAMGTWAFLEHAPVERELLLRLLSDMQFTKTVMT
jgi:hypothetical protein